MPNEELRTIIALIRRLGSDVVLTTRELEEAGDFELQRSDPQLSFTESMRYRVRLAPVTIEGETVLEVNGSWQV